ncbi:hypothetical protein EDB86DRAFT_256500 [Lactarius hatsudake]|nr:hypothetical protein EDB86DRAFT_256500 [Lactarius hatsudake]
MDPSMIDGGGNLSPGKFPSSPVRGFGGVQISRATDEDEDEVMGVNTSDDDFMPPSGLGKDKGRAVVVDGVVESSESVAAARWFEDAEEDPARGKDRADEVVGQNNDIDDESDDDDGPCARAISAPDFTNARRKETHRAPGRANVLPPLQKHDTPTQDAMYVDQGRRTSDAATILRLLHRDTVRHPFIYST